MIIQIVSKGGAYAGRIQLLQAGLRAHSIRAQLVPSSQASSVELFAISIFLLEELDGLITRGGVMVAIRVFGKAWLALMATQYGWRL